MKKIASLIVVAAVTLGLGWMATSQRAVASPPASDRLELQMGQPVAQRPALSLTTEIGTCH